MIGKVCPQATIYEADNIENAVQMAGRIEPKLAFIDVILGDEDGLRCARRVKAVSPHSRIVLISAYPTGSSTVWAWNPGQSLFWIRKIDLPAIKQVIDDIL